MPTDFSQAYRGMNGLLTAAERGEVELKALAHRRARAVHAGVERRMPSATGKMRAALHIVERGKSFSVEVGDIPGRSPMVPVYIEFGTVGMSARPMFRPAVDENRDGYLQDAAQTITSLLEKGWR